MNKFRKVAKPSATTRWIISTVFAVSVFTPAVTTVLSENAAGSLSAESVAWAASGRASRLPRSRTWTTRCWSRAPTAWAPS